MNLQEQIERIQSMMGIISEELSPSIRRRLNFNNAQKEYNGIKISSFKKGQPVEDSVEEAIYSLVYSVVPYGFDEDIEGGDEEYNKIINKLFEYFNNQYGEDLKQYYEKRQKDSEQEKEDVKYIFVKHDKSYYERGWRGFESGFDSFNDLLTKYGSWVDVDWDEVKRNLDDINDYPEETFTGSMNSRPLRISSIGDEGNDWGYNFSIIKQISKDDLNESKVNINESKLSMGIQKTVNNSLDELKEQAEEWGLGEMDEIDEVESIDDIIVTNVVMDEEPIVYLDFRVSSDRRNFDNVQSVISHDISKYLPKARTIVSIVDTRTFGPGIDW